MDGLASQLDNPNDFCVLILLLLLYPQQQPPARWKDYYYLKQFYTM